MKLKKIRKVLFGLALLQMIFMACTKDDGEDIFSENNNAPTLSFKAYNDKILYDIKSDTIYNFKSTLTDSSLNDIEEFIVYYEVSDEESIDITASSLDDNISLLIKDNGIIITGDLLSNGVQVEVRVVDSFGLEVVCNLQFTFDFNVAPGAILSANRVVDQPDDYTYVYNLDASKSVDKDGKIVLYDFYIDDVLVFSTTESVVQYTFNSVGVHQIKVQVTDNNGLKSQYESDNCYSIKVPY